MFQRQYTRGNTNSTHRNESSSLMRNRIMDLSIEESAIETKCIVVTKNLAEIIGALVNFEILHCAKNGEEALRFVKQNLGLEIDFVLFDLELQGINACKTIKKLSKAKLIGYSTFVDDVMQDIALNAGFYKILKKPLKARDF